MLRLFPFLIVIIMASLLSGCGNQASSSLIDLRPISCHREPIAGLFFVMVENHGHDAGPSTAIVSFHTNVPELPRVNIRVKTPPVQDGGDVLVSVELPSVPGTTESVLPVGKVEITLDADHSLTGASRAHSTLFSDCHD